MHGSQTQIRSGIKENPFFIVPTDFMTAALPRILWIELTSKCPYDCVFCSRKMLRGAGEHMDFNLYASILGQLRNPEIIRLNYSGESAHYPRLIDAIGLARATGAFTELVSAFSSYPDDKIEALITSGLDRLTVSLHTLDADQFARVYRFSSLGEMRQKLAFFRECQRRLGTPKPILDFAFVALEENLTQLPAIAGYARDLGIRNLFVHPVIRRVDLQAQFNLELENNRLRTEFKQKLRRAMDEVAADFPEIDCSVSTAELEPGVPVDSRPHPCATRLPDGARIFSCEQNPWESIHILANGDVVVCEVQDDIAMGNLIRQSLETIWHGQAYGAFRRQYQLGHVATCNTCPYKTAYYPAPLEPMIRASQGGSAQLLRGWHSGEPGIVWSKQSSSAVLGTHATAKRFAMRGLLPPSHGRDNRLSIACNGKGVGVVTNQTTGHHSFEVRVRIPESTPVLHFEFATNTIYRTADDSRELGFALQCMQVE